MILLGAAAVIITLLGMAQDDITLGDPLLAVGIGLGVLWLVIWCACPKVRRNHERRFPL